MMKVVVIYMVLGGAVFGGLYGYIAYIRQNKVNDDNNKK